MKTVFLSYARPDVESARRLAAEIRDLGFKVWFDEDSLLPGQHWRNEIESAIRETDFFLALLSSKSVDRRGYVQAELAKALSVLDELPPDKVFIIPARLDVCEPIHPRLHDLHWVDLFSDWARAIRKIALALGVKEVPETPKSQRSVWASAAERLAGDNPALLLSDGTDFAADLGELAQSAGFDLMKISPGWQVQAHAIEEGLLGAHGLLILVRGEGFTQTGHEGFYSELSRFVSDGGKLFATPWVAWENKLHYRLSEALPFEHLWDTYNENVLVTCGPTESDLATKLFLPAMSFRSSFEKLRAKEDSVVLCEMGGGVPLFGYQHVGKGLSYYLNTCQHYCSGSMPSPLRASPELRAGVHRVFKWIFDSPG